MQPVSGTQAAGAPTATVPQPRLVRAAHEFEAQMMKELLKPMTGQDTLAGDDEGAGVGVGSNAALGEFASEALGQALSQRGGFGIARSILHDLSHSGNGNGTGTVTGISHGDTVMRASKTLK